MNGWVNAPIMHPEQQQQPTAKATEGPKCMEGAHGNITVSATTTVRQSSCCIVPVCMSWMCGYTIIPSSTVSIGRLFVHPTTRYPRAIKTPIAKWGNERKTPQLLHFHLDCHHEQQVCMYFIRLKYELDYHYWTAAAALCVDSLG